MSMRSKIGTFNRSLCIIPVAPWYRDYRIENDQMEPVYECGKSGLQAILIRGLGTERDDAERELLQAGVPLPFSHRALWAAHLSHWEPWFLMVRDASGRARAGLAIETIRTHAMPGHTILRVGKFGGSMAGDICRVALQAFTSLGARTPRVLRLQLNVFSQGGREVIAKTLGELGFHEVQPPSSYRYTLVIDLKPTEDQILASFSTNARRRIRETTKMSLRSLVITDPMYAERLNELHQEAFQRTGGHGTSKDWQVVLRICHEHPNLSRILGLFPNEDAAPENMEAFLWVCNNGDHVEYRSAGSARRTDARIPLGYLLAWDSIRWAKAIGAEWFDMGGVTLTAADETALEGISRFKRNFSREVVEVGAEWRLEPRPVRAGIATVISNTAHLLRAGMGRLD